MNGEESRGKGVGGLRKAGGGKGKGEGEGRDNER